MRENSKTNDFNASKVGSMKRESKLISLCLAGIIIFYVYHCFYWYSYVIDDAYITFRYARNFINGLGLVYNPGEHIEGYSNFLWLILIASGMKFGIDPVFVAKFIGLFSGIGVILCSRWVFNKLSSAPRPWVSLIAPFFLATNSFFCFWSFAGLETVFFSFLMILGVALYLRENHKKFPFSACVFGLMCLTRPEGIGYLVVFFAVSISLCMSRGERSLAYWAKFCGIAFVFVAGQHIFRYIYYGELLPNAYFCKVPAVLGQEGAKYLFNFWLGYRAPLSILFLISIIAIVRFCDRRARILLFLIFFTWLYIALVALDWMPNYRYQVQTIPLVFVAIAIGLSELALRSKIGVMDCRKFTIKVVILSLILCNTILSFAVDQSSGGMKSVSKWLNMMQRAKYGFTPALLFEAAFLSENSGKDVTVGMRDIGFAGYLSDCRVYDMAWLTNREAKIWSSILKTRDERLIDAYIFGEMRENLKKNDPDFFIYPTDGLSKMRASRRKMYDDYFSGHMDLMLENDYARYYKKRGLKRQLSIEELVVRYERIVFKHPRYPFLKWRLRCLQSQIKNQSIIADKD